MTVSNRNREKLHMAMTADGNSRFRERDGSLGLLVRLDNEEEIDGLVSGGLDWSGTTHPSRDDIRVRMAVSNKDRERFHMAMTADGDSQDEAVSGSLGLALFARGGREVRRPRLGRPRLERRPRGHYDGQQPEPREAAHGDDRGRQLAIPREGRLPRAARAPR